MTRFNNKYPYTDFHELNADWLLETVKDAEAEAKEAAETVETYNDRLTTVEGDLAPIKAAMPGLASDVSDLQHDVGIMDSLITNTINPGLDTLQNEVETPSTGLLDRMTAAEGSISTLQNEVETPTTGLLDRVTALENQPSTGGVTEYLRFGTGGTPIDYDPRITYTYLDGLIATQASADKTVNVVLVEDDEVGSTWYYTLDAGRYQVSAGTPRGGFAFTCRKPVLDGNNVVIGYNVCTVDVDKNAATPTYTEVYEALLPAVTSANAGDVLTVDNSGNWVNDTLSIPGTESGTIAYTHTDITANAYWYRVGEVVTVTTLFNPAYTGLSGDLFTLPYQPKTGFGITYRPSDPTKADLRGWVSGSTGVVSISTTTDASVNYGASFSYIRA